MNKTLLEIEMLKQGVTMEQLAERIGISRSAMSKKINGKSEFRQSEMQKIVKVLEIADPTPIFFAR